MRYSWAVADLNANSSRQEENAQEWSRRLAEKVEAVLAVRPDADADNVRHTLILLQLPPIERLQRSLIRGRAALNRK